MTSMTLSSTTTSAIWKVIRNAFTGALAVGLCLAVVTCRNERENARISSVQSFNLGRVAEFRDTGARLDQKVAAYNDAAMARESMAQLLIAEREAMAEHAAKTMAIQDTIGEAEARSYLKKLKVLQRAVEANATGERPGPVITALSGVVVARNTLAKKVLN